MQKWAKNLRNLRNLRIKLFEWIPDNSPPNAACKSIKRLATGRPQRTALKRRKVPTPIIEPLQISPPWLDFKNCDKFSI